MSGSRAGCWPAPVRPPVASSRLVQGLGAPAPADGARGTVGAALEHVKMVLYGWCDCVTLMAEVGSMAGCHRSAVGTREVIFRQVLPRGPDHHGIASYRATSALSSPCGSGQENGATIDSAPRCLPTTARRIWAADRGSRRRAFAERAEAAIRTRDPGQRPASGRSTQADR
jgi:hypothetical protein